MRWLQGNLRKQAYTVTAQGPDAFTEKTSRLLREDTEGSAESAPLV